MEPGKTIISMGQETLDGEDCRLTVNACKCKRIYSHKENESYTKRSCVDLQSGVMYGRVPLCKDYKDPLPYRPHNSHTWWLR
jgi:hypothetical protein